jgi:8-oxo-dGTP pyrophosphatase MutT (NUDIX family)
MWYSEIMVLDLTDGVIKNVRAVIWKKGGDGPLFLLTQEPSGVFTIPGGCKDAKDADLLSALRRELQEELCLEPGDYSVQATDISKEYERLYNSTPERIGKNTIISLFIVSNLTKEPKASAEIENIVWLPANEALEKLTPPHMNELFRRGLERIDERK